MASTSDSGTLQWKRHTKRMKKDAEIVETYKYLHRDKHNELVLTTCTTHSKLLILAYCSF
uniref:Uncharacterized protein n=1 Tax=Anguilla anguilla TaxID=7936 RepID=A0A0E9PXB2_ANGAN